MRLLVGRLAGSLVDDGWIDCIWWFNCLHQIEIIHLGFGFKLPAILNRRQNGSTNLVKDFSQPTNVQLDSCVYPELCTSRAAASLQDRRVLVPVAAVSRR